MVKGGYIIQVVYIKERQFKLQSQNNTQYNIAELIVLFDI